jgi:DNA primase
MDEIQEVLSRLEGVREVSDGWMALCPAHDDHDPSLSVTEGEEQPVLLHCWAGCTPREVVAALGLDFSDICEGGKSGAGAQSEVLSEVQRRRQKWKRRRANTNAKLRRIERAKAKMSRYERMLFRLCCQTQHNSEATTEVKKSKRKTLIQRALNR